MLGQKAVYPNEPAMPGLACLAVVEAEVTRDGKTTTNRRYYLPSARLTAEKFAQAARAHGGIENRLHWILDVTFEQGRAPWA